MNYSNLNPEQQKVYREWVVGLLTMDEAVVTFTKKDGTERKMLCTLKSEVLPRNDKRDERQRSEEALSVWDIEKESWRSFRFDSIKYIYPKSGENNGTEGS